MTEQEKKKKNAQYNALISLIAWTIVFIANLFVLKFGWNVLFVDDTWRIVEEPMRQMTMTSALVSYVVLHFVGGHFKGDSDD